MSSRALAVLAMVVVFLFGATPAVSAEKGDKQVRFGVMFSSPTNDLTEDGTTIEADSAFGIQGGFEFFVRDNFGIEPALSFANHDAEASEPGFPTVTIGDTSLTTITVNFNFHLTPDGPVDFYVGPTVGYAMWGDLESDFFGETFPLDDDFTYGLNLGVDAPFGEGDWFFSGVVNWLVVEAQFEDADPGDAPLDVDPLQLKLGVGKRF